MPNVSKSYVSYLLRLQRVAGDAVPAWKPSLQSTATGERQWFPNLDVLFQFLSDEFGDKEMEDTGQQTCHEPD